MINVFQNKKAQLTIFIILGVIIVAGAALLLFLREPVEEGTVEESGERIPYEFEPIKEFVTSCLDDVAKEALIKLGQHGGYIDMNDPVLTDRAFTLDPAKPTESDGAFLTLDETHPVAYWWYMTSKSDCSNSCYFSDGSRPAIEQMASQVDKYVRDNIGSCLDSFKQFVPMGFVVRPISDPAPTTTIAEKDVVVKLRYPLEVTFNDKTSEITSFMVREELKLRKLYDFATEIVRAEVDTSFLERIFLHLITMNSRADFDALPPLYAQENSYVPYSWSLPLVKTQMESLLTSHIPIIQINNTNGAVKPEISSDPMIQNLYDPFFVDVLEEPRPEYQVRFFYLGWPIYLDITPREKSTIKPSKKDQAKNDNLMGIAVPATFKPVYYYKYFYDVSVPIIVEVRSHDEFFNETYTFLFAIEANLKDNYTPRDWFDGKAPAQPRSTPLLVLKANGEVEESIEMDPETPSDEDVSSSPLISGNFNKTLFCNSKQRISGNVTVVVYDKTNGSRLENVDVTYSCGDYQTCSIGRIVEHEDGDPESRYLMERFPVCVGGGILDVKADGYLQKKVYEITTLPDEDILIEVKMDRLRTKNISFKKFVLNRTLEYDSELKETKYLSWDPTARDLDPTDMLMLTLYKVDSEPRDKQFSAFVVYYGNDSLNKDIFRTIDLIPGAYSVTIQYISKNKTVIEKNCQHVCKECNTDDNYYDCRSNNGDPYTCDIDYWTPDEDVEMDMNVLGGLEIPAENPWLVTTYDLDDLGDTVEFRFVQTSTPRCIQDMDEIDEVETFYVSNRQELVPKFGVQVEEEQEEQQT